jgi:hypothetical protein
VPFVTRPVAALMSPNRPLPSCGPPDNGLRFAEAAHGISSETGRRLIGRTMRKIEPRLAAIRGHFHRSSAVLGAEPRHRDSDPAGRTSPVLDRRGDQREHMLSRRQRLQRRRQRLRGQSSTDLSPASALSDRSRDWRDRSPDRHDRSRSAVTCNAGPA